jgi:hypothetical protein
MRHSAAFLLLFILAITVSLSASQKTQNPNSKPLTNADVLDMLNAGVSDQVVVAKIKKSACDFDTSPTTLKSLRASKISDAVILAMIAASVDPNAASASPVVESAARPARVDCSYSEPVPVFSAPRVASESSSVQPSFSVKCGDKITIIEPINSQSWLKIQTNDGLRSGYISSSIIAVLPLEEPPKQTIDHKREALQSASDQLEDCRVRAQNEYDTKMGAVNTLLLTPVQRVYAATRLKQNYDAAVRNCRSQYEARLKDIESN